MLPRWALIANWALGLYDWMRTKATGTQTRHRRVLDGGYGNTSAYLVGMIHGIGAETPTQVLLFVLALGAGVAGGRGGWGSPRPGLCPRAGNHQYPHGGPWGLRICGVIEQAEALQNRRLCNRVLQRPPGNSLHPRGWRILT